MRFLSTLATVAASALLAMAPASAQQKNMPLPFDGRFQKLTLTNLDQTYLLHIIKMKPNNGTGNVADYVKIDQKGRSPAYNGDTGVMSVAVDDKSIFKEMYNFRRTEIVQFVEGNPTGTTFFRASIRADEVIQNKATWQALFTESHVFDVYTDFNQTTPKLQFLADSWTLQYETEFKYKTWYNVGIAVESTGYITFYLSEGDAPLKKVCTTKKALASDKIPADYELHFGMLLYSKTDNPPMVKNHQDKLLFNGLTVDKTGPDASGAVTGSFGNDDDDDDTPATTSSPASAPAPAAGAKPSKCMSTRA